MTEEIPKTESSVNEVESSQRNDTSVQIQSSSPSDTSSPAKPLNSDIQAASFTSNSPTHSSTSANSLPTPPPFPLPNHPIWERQKVVSHLARFTSSLLLYFFAATERAEY